MMQGAAPVTEQRVPLVAIVPEQQSSPLSPGTFPQPGPPQRPQAKSQHTPSITSSKPARPLLQVLLEVTSTVGPSRGTRERGLKRWGRLVVYFYSSPEWSSGNLAYPLVQKSKFDSCQRRIFMRAQV